MLHSLVLELVVVRLGHSYVMELKVACYNVFIQLDHAITPMMLE